MTLIFLSVRQAGVRTNALCLHAVLYDAGVTTDMGSVSMPCLYKQHNIPKKESGKPWPKIWAGFSLDGRLSRCSRVL